MKRRLLSSLFLLAVGVPRSVRAQDAIAIYHEPLVCAVAARFVRIEARIEPAPQTLAPLVQFHAAGVPGWYFVGMRRDGEVYTAILPQPLETTRQVQYVIRADNAASQEYSAAVVRSGACAGSQTSAHAHAVAIFLGRPPGGAEVPPGFAAAGIAGMVDPAPVPRVSPAPGVVAPGSRVRLMARAIVEVPGVVRIEGRSVTSPKGSVVIEDERSVSITLPDGRRRTVPRPGATLVGTLLGVDNDSFILLPEHGELSVTVPRSVIASVEVDRSGASHDKHNRIASAVVGAAGGVLLGEALCQNQHGFFSPSPTDCAVGLGSLLAAGGAATGIIDLPGRWEPVAMDSVHVTIAPILGRGVGAIVSLSF